MKLIVFVLFCVFPCFFSYATPMHVKTISLSGKIEPLTCRQTQKSAYLISQNKRYEIVGDLVLDLCQMKNAVFEIQAEWSDSALFLPRLQVKEYQIQDLGQGEKPEIGDIQLNAQGVIVIKNLKGQVYQVTPSAMRDKLHAYLGSRIWMIYKKTNDQEVKISRIGFLNEIRTPVP